MKKIGNQTFVLDNPISILETSSIVRKERRDWASCSVF